MPLPTSIPSSGPSTIYPGDYSGSLNSLVFGPSTNIQLESLDGWRDMTSKPLGGVMTGAASSLLPAPMGYQNGSWPVDYWMDKREVKLVLAVLYNGGDWETAIEALESATGPTGTGSASLSIQIGGLTTSVTGVVESRILPTNKEYELGLARAAITFVAFDPRRMWTPITATTGLPASSGGLTVPFTVPFSITSTQTSGRVNITNPGSVNGPLTIQIFGPCTGPVVTHLQTGLQVAFPPSVSIAAGDSITVDMEAQTALYNGLASRPVLTPGWFNFYPGVNTIAFTATTGTAATITVTGTPASI